MTIQLTTGDLLEQRVDAIVNTVNTVGVMGKGIALQFKRKWPANAKAYEAACKHGEVKPGKMFVFDNGGLVDPKFIINFPTKRHWRQPSRLSDIEFGLVDLVAQIKRLGIRSIALPPLGCGSGGLDWNDVRPRIETAMKELPSVDIRLFAPSDVPGVRELAAEASKPRMTSGRAAIVKVRSDLSAAPLSVQLKMKPKNLSISWYRLAKNLGTLKFQKHIYGPYAPALRHILTKMSGTYLCGVGDGTRRSEINLIWRCPARGRCVSFFVPRSRHIAAGLANQSY